MGSGGHANSGPAPSPDAIRRDRPSDQAAWVTLPASREGDPPPWPLPESTKREDAMWVRLWKLPQATEWERLGAADEVAIYVRTFCEASVLDASTDRRKLAGTQAENLGLGVTGLARRRWRIASETTTEALKTNDRRRPSAKERLAKIVEIESRRTA